MKIAIIGSGISGLSSALLLSHEHKITLIESDMRFGGHANTITVSTKNGSVPVDTGFIVYNTLNYPNLVGFFDFLNVETVSSDMSFAVSSGNGRLEYSGSLKGLFAQKKNLFNLSFYKMLKDIIRFFIFGYKYAYEIKSDESLKDYLKRCNFSQEFINDHLIPMSSAIWSCPENEILNFPAKSLLTFFKNHQLINFIFRPKWRTVKNGSKEYVKKVINELEKKPENRLLLNTKIKSISLQNKNVKINFENKSEIFDKVIMATHPDQAIKLLKNLDKTTQNLLKNFKYQKNVVYLHSDSSLMPENKKTWSSWNYLSNNKKKSETSITYWMNLLQKLNSSKNFFVSLNPFFIPDSNLTYKKIIYEHPIFNNNTNKAQKKMSLIQGKNNIYFTGAWLGYGFHEDGIKSAVKVAKLFQINIPWKTK